MNGKFRIFENFVLIKHCLFSFFTQLIHFSVFIEKQENKSFILAFEFQEWKNNNLMQQGQLVYKLNTISLLPQQISFSLSEKLQLSSKNLFKLQIHLSNILLEETHDLSLQSQINQNGRMSIKCSTPPFRFFPIELFSKSKVSRLKINLLAKNDQQEYSLLEAFNIVISEYSYEFCKSKFNEFKQHSVGGINKGILHYKILCEYEEHYINNKKDQQKDKEIAQQLLLQSKQIFKQKKKNAQLQTMPDEQQQYSSEGSEVFIQLKMLKPVYRHSSYEDDKLRFKLEQSNIVAGGFAENQYSIFRQNKKIRQSTYSIFGWSLDILLVVGVIFVGVQMNPTPKF